MPVPRRRAVANDLTRPELIVVSHSTNIAKGGQGPQSRRPSRRAAWCRHATSWITVKHHDRLFATRKEKCRVRIRADPMQIA
ncbi:hypothetical protein [Nonomuraea cavernae]|uniref:hypothetical protein n=1 Tax=Nonomuraea cavernae TaxID=2045107 RepID=UPI0033C0BA2C